MKKIIVLGLALFLFACGDSEGGEGGDGGNGSSGSGQPQGPDYDAICQAFCDCGASGCRDGHAPCVGVYKEIYEERITVGGCTAQWNTWEACIVSITCMGGACRDEARVMGDCIDQAE